MKIKCISKIDNFSIFKNFDWNQNLSLGNNQTYDFKDINIFYGRNYSGKTSLSKIIRALDTKTISTKYANPNFQIEFVDKSIISQNNLTTFTHPIHVYNSDFVKENLKFIHDENANIESFSVTLGGDNQQILDRIKELNDELGLNEDSTKSGLYLDIQNKDNKVRCANTDHQSKVRDLDKKLSDKATRGSNSIKDNHERFGEIRYDKRNLEADISTVLNNNYQQLTRTQIELFESIIQQRELSAPPELLPYTLNFSSLINSTSQILKTVVGGSQKLEELVKDSELNLWVQKGQHLHKDRSSCAFCTNEISQQRQTELRQHFDQETQILQDRIADGIEQINKLLGSQSFKISFDINHYYQQHHVLLTELRANLHTNINLQKKSLEEIIKLLEQKNRQPFTELKAEYPIDYSDHIKAILEQISAIRDECIQLNSNLNNQQKEAKNALRLNHVYHFLQDINFTQQNLDINLAFQVIAPLEAELTALNSRKATILSDIEIEKAKLKSEGEACRRINEILQHDFGHQHLSLEPIETFSTNGQSIKFEIQRLKNGIKTKAHNLSEGECSLISFCYFLAKIQDDLDQDKNPIIWIDDPICSLDSNHIFFIYSLINEKICAEKKFSQLFISTHNIEFLKYLRRIEGVESDNAIGQVGEQKRKAGYFLIQRHDNFSTIRQMPLYLSKFLTEFNFLFDQIYKCATVNQIDDSNFHIFYNFGNNARKFLEIYTFYKFPSPKYQLDSQLKSFWGEQIHKTLTDRIHNEYSHMTGVLERGESISEQPEMQKSAKAIIQKVQQEDLNQYNALLESIGITPTP
ncbi:MULTISPECIES: AAA family ATPase [unclassified Acinetobacter]|uniref:AAA family ATPase n=1 Tax=unclassified Acinetobacter TaxID=196816 RepID=UPI0015D35472|nr:MULTISPECIES: AAA family ATPase [unclassified Acinetobacter]